MTDEELNALRGPPDPRTYEPFDHPELDKGFWITEADGSCGGFMPYAMAVWYADEVKRLRAENKRLRTLLKESR